MGIITISALVGISIIAIIVLTSRYKLKAFIALFLVSLFLAFTTLPPGTIVATLKEGFGNTMASIGFLIILGAIIGITLDKTGGTLSIAGTSFQNGNATGAPAMAITGLSQGCPYFVIRVYHPGLAKSFTPVQKWQCHL